MSKNTSTLAKQLSPVLFTVSVASVLLLCWLPTGIMHLVVIIWGVSIPTWLQTITLVLFALSALCMTVLSLVTIPAPEGFDWDRKMSGLSATQKFFWNMAGGVILVVNFSASLVASIYDVSTSSRFAMSIVSLFGIIGCGYWTFVVGENAGTLTAVNNVLLLAAVLMWTASIVLFTLRGLLGILRVLPKSWRKQPANS